jgi:putative oxidoreductase
MKNKTNLSEIIAALLVTLYVYTAASKLLDFPAYQVQMRLQVLPAWCNELLIWTVPPAELVLSALLFGTVTRLTGLIGSAVLLSCFTLYVGLASFHFFDQVPCACGGVFSRMGWNTHFWFNLFILLINILAIPSAVRERRNTAS